MLQIEKSLARRKAPILCTVMFPAICLSWAACATDDHGHSEHIDDSHDQYQEQQGEHGDRAGGHDSHDGHGDHDDNPVSIDPGIAVQAGIGVSTAGPVTLEIVTQAYGKLVIPPDQEAHIHARFPGLVKAINVHVGDRVSKDDVLAVIESNESLSDYTIKAPMSGIVTKRQLNLGEVTDGEPLVVIVNADVLWAELRIFPQQRSVVKPGQLVYLAREHRELESSITHIAPSDIQAPYMLARANVDNAQQKFTPGELVRADIVVEKVNVPIAVENRALQTMEGQQVVFVQEGDAYGPRVLTLGRTDGHFTEVVQGLQPGETYVSDNSYLIKADIEKSGAGHHH